MGRDTQDSTVHNDNFPRLVTDLLDDAVATYGDSHAIDFIGRKWSYSQLGNLVERAARGLQNLGVGPDTKVGICLPNSPYFVIFYFAILKVGGVVVNYNPLYAERELERLIVDSGTTVMVVADLQMCLPIVSRVAEKLNLSQVLVCRFAAILPPLKSIGYRLLKRREIARIPCDERHIPFEDLLRSSVTPLESSRKPSDLAVMQYTGGTTGLPKAAMLSHANLVANTMQMVAHVGAKTTRRERTLGVIPLFHVFALTTILNYSVESGAEMILLPRFEMKQFLKTIKRTRPTQFFTVPTILTAINALPSDQQLDFQSVRLCISGGAPLPLDVRQTFERRTNCRVTEGYGLTEASPIIACNPLGDRARNNSVGIPFPDTTIEIRDLEDPHRAVERGGTGEVCVKGPQIMSGYWCRKEDTEDAFIDGLLRTGDVGYFDGDGYLYLVDRIKDLIICGGYNVYPRVIEDALHEHWSVSEVMVIGVPDAYRGQSPKAFVVLHAGDLVTSDDLKDFLRDKLSKIEMPHVIEIRESLPKTTVGKLSKKMLMDEEKARLA